MLKLLRKFGRPFLPLFFIAVLLLIARAALELSLPKLMSDIVDVGIAQGGVDDVIPNRLTPNSFAELGEPHFYAFNRDESAYFLIEEMDISPEDESHLISAIAALQHGSADLTQGAKNSSP